jgi:hypothetical protein
MVEVIFARPAVHNGPVDERGPLMKVGLVVECGRDGPEVIICRKICQLLAEDHGLVIELVIAPMDNKQILLAECGQVAANLLADDCEHVVILWNERPAWPKIGEPLCWFNERKKILDELKIANVSDDDAHLVCIEREFESWLLYDHKMLECVLSTPAHRVTIPKQKNPHRHPNPKSAMTTLFRKLAGKTYVDVQFAQRMANCLTALNRLRKCATFTRFESKVTGKQ